VEYPEKGKNLTLDTGEVLSPDGEGFNLCPENEPPRNILKNKGMIRKERSRGRPGTRGTKGARNVEAGPHHPDLPVIKG